MKYLFAFIALMILSQASFAKLHTERFYQERWCTEGKIEYRLPDATRVDCLLDDYAIEMDFADKWYEAIGQSLWYAVQTNRLPGIVLIIEEDKDKVNLDRLNEFVERYWILRIRVWTISP